MRHGDPRVEIPRLAQELGAGAVYANRDYEPAAIARDGEINRRLAAADSCLMDFKDQVIFERAEVMTQAGRPFTVFTPYKNAWLRTLTPSHLVPHDVDGYTAALAPPPQAEDRGLPTLAAMGFARTNLAALGIVVTVAAGLYIILRERAIAARPATP